MGQLQKADDGDDDDDYEEEEEDCSCLGVHYFVGLGSCLEFGHVWLLTTFVYLLKLLYINSCVVGGRMARNLFILFCSLYVLIIFSAAFCTAHCALDLARDQAPKQCSLLLLLF